MKFRSNAGNLTKILFQVVNIATRNCDTYSTWSRHLCIIAKPDELTLIANGGTLAIKITVKGSLLSELGYTCIIEGSVVLKARNFYECIKSHLSAKYIDVHYTGNLSITQEGYGDIHIPTPFMPIGFPDIPKNKPFTIKRDVLLKGLRAVKYAMGEFETQYYYMCLHIEVSNNHAQFAAGTGASFAVKDFMGKGIARIKKKTSILLPSTKIGNITALLAKSKSDTITIKKTYEKIPRIIIEYDNVCLVIDTSSLISESGKLIQYPPMDKIINAGRSFKISFDINKWKDAIEGIKATITKEFIDQGDIHYSLVQAHIEDRYFQISSRADGRSIRTVPVTNIIDLDKGTDKNQVAWFCCNSVYLSEIASKSGKHTEATIEFEDWSKLEGDPDAKSKPVLVKYPETNKKGIKERFCMFFATVEAEKALKVKNNIINDESEEVIDDEIKRLCEG